MKTTQEYLADLHAHYGTTTTYALAKAMGLGDQTVRGWTKGHSFSDAHAVMVADLLGLDRGEVLAAASAERSKCPAARDAWKRIADQLSGQAAAALLAVIAAPLGLAFSAGAGVVLIMSSERSRASWL
jgi:hypothetical protein